MSILRGDAALVYATQARVEVTVAGVLKLPPERARELLAQAGPAERKRLLDDTTVLVRGTKAA